MPRPPLSSLHPSHAANPPIHEQGSPAAEIRGINRYPATYGPSGSAKRKSPRSNGMARRLIAPCHSVSDGINSQLAIFVHKRLDQVARGSFHWFEFNQPSNTSQPEKDASMEFPPQFRVASHPQPPQLRYWFRFQQKRKNRLTGLGHAGSLLTSGTRGRCQRVGVFPLFCVSTGDFLA